MSFSKASTRRSHACVYSVPNSAEGKGAAGFVRKWGGGAPFADPLPRNRFEPPARGAWPHDRDHVRKWGGGAPFADPLPRNRFEPPARGAWPHDRDHQENNHHCAGDEDEDAERAVVPQAKRDDEADEDRA